MTDAVPGDFRPRTIDANLVRRLIAAQFPQWGALDIRPVLPGGHDNRTFRLGPALSVRLPHAPAYDAQVRVEHRWLPVLAASLPVPIAEPVALGAPSDLFPAPWSVRLWLPGETALAEPPADPVALAVDLARFLHALHRIDTTAAPPAGPQTFHRGGDLRIYDADARRAIRALDLPPLALALWNRAVATGWDRPPVWVHGDVAPGNLLLRDGRLSAVIDFGQVCVGDPACDLIPRWTMFDGPARAAFVAALPFDMGTWDRARGWALWKAAITLAGTPAPDMRTAAQRVLAAVLSD